MRVYIAGKISGLPTEQVKQKFATAEALITANNWTTVNPTKHVNHKASHAEAMAILIPLLCECQAIYLLEDWIFSEGAQIEAQMARYIGLHIINEDDLT